MGYLKAFILAVVVCLFTVFIVQNITPLNQTIQLRMDLYFTQYECPPLAVHLLILMAFFLGLLLASLVGVSERFRMRRTLRKAQREIQSINNEVQSLRNLPLSNKPLSGSEAVPVPEEGL